MSSAQAHLRGTALGCAQRGSGAPPTPLPEAPESTVGEDGTGMGPVDTGCSSAEGRRDATPTPAPSADAVGAPAAVLAVPTAAPSTESAADEEEDDEDLGDYAG